MRPIIALAIVILGFVSIAVFNQYLLAAAIVAIGLAFLLFSIKPIYAILFLLIIRPALDQYSSYFNFDFGSQTDLQLSGNVLFSIVSIIFALLVIISLLRANKTSLKNLFKNKVVIATTAILGISIISVFYSIYAEVSVLEIARLVNIFLYFIVFWLYVKNSKRLRLVMYSIFASALIPFVVAIWQLIIGRGVVSNIGESFRIYGTFAHPNHLAIFSFLIFAIAATFFAWQQSRKVFDKIALTMAIISAGMIMLTTSRGAFLAMMIFIIILGLKKYKKALIFILLAIVIATLIYIPLQDRLLNMFENSQFSSGRWRLDHWHDMYFLRVLQRPVFGHGSGTAFFAAESLYGPIYEGDSYDMHNDYLLMLVELGYVGLIIYLSWLAALLFPFIKAYKKAGSERVLYTGMIGMFVGVLLINFLDNFWRGTAIMIVFVTVIGAVMGYAKSSLEEK